MSQSVDDIRARALDLLAIREHSQLELARKLKTKGFEETLVAEIIAELGEQDLQSDVRFAESYVQSRAGRGDGPLKIRYQLKERGINSEIIGETLASLESEWHDGAAAARAKRFGVDVPTDYKEKARQSRFLQRRGFSIEHIRAALKR